MSNQPAFLYNSVIDDGNDLSAKLSTHTVMTGSAGACSAIGIARPSRDGTATVQKSSNNSTWETVDYFEFAANRCMLGFFESSSSDYWRVVFDDETTLAVVKLGLALRMTQRNYQGVAPAIYNQQSSLSPREMNRGQYLGRQSYARVAKAEYQTDKTTMVFLRSDVMPMIEALREGAGVFYAWRPDKYPQDVIYGNLSGGISPETAGTLNFMQFSIAIDGILDTSPSTYDKPVVVAP
jgi:hypothetical protein